MIFWYFEALIGSATSTRYSGSRRHADLGASAGLRVGRVWYLRRRAWSERRLSVKSGLPVK